MKQKLNQRLKRTLSCILALTIAASMTTVIPVTAEDNMHRTYSGDDYEVSYNIKGSWDGNQNIEITLTNTGSESLLNWALKYDAHGEIGGLWNSTVYDSDSTKYIVKNAGYNYEILPKQTITFGYTLTGDNPEFPETVELCSQRTERATEGYSVKMSVMDDWDTGFTGTITIENLGDSALEAWQLSFDTNFVIADLWNAQILSSEGNSYTVANDVTTTPIGVGKHKVLGFTSTKESGCEPKISNFVMSEITVNNDFNTVDIPYDDDVELAILAFGEYLAEDNALNIEWFTNVENGSFELMESYNNKDYITTTILNDTYSYIYTISEDFDVRYFKVMHTTEDGQTAESVPFVVTKSDDGYSVVFLDSDSDGLADIYEEIIGTDVNDPDTDSDGLTDYQEVYITGTDPNKYDSVTEGVSDADADLDADGLSNVQEIELGTDPMNPDSDGDDLSDGEEVNDYHTDPLKADTDKDGIPDGDELHIGLDPTNPETFGYPDSEYVSEQTISADSNVFSEINTDDNAYELSLKVKANGYAEGNIAVKESGYAAVIESDMILGKIPEISLGSTCNAEEIVLYYNIADSYVENELGTYAAENEELSGIKRLGVFTFNEEYNILVPVATEYDIENSVVSANVQSDGTYFLVDYEKWFEEWGLSSNVVFSNYSLRTNSKSTSEVEKISKADVVFSINTSSYPKNHYNDSLERNLEIMKENVHKTAEDLFKNGEDIRIAISGYSQANTDVIPAKLSNHTYISGENEWAKNIEEVDILLSQLEIDNGLTFGYLEAALQDAADPIDGVGQPYEWRDDADKYAFVYTTSLGGYSYYPQDSSEYYSTVCSLMAIYNTMSRKNIKASFALDNPKATGYPIRWAKETTGGTAVDYYNISGTTEAYDFIYETANKLTVKEEIKNPAQYISSLTLHNITLDETLEINSDTDTDSDGLTDWQETDTDSKLFTYTPGMKPVLPTYEQCINCVLIDEDAKTVMEQLRNKMPVSDFNHIKDMHVLPLKSDPTKEDSDDDGLLDGRAQINSKGQKVAPKDSDPLIYNGAEGLWKRYISEMKNDRAATALGDWSIADMVDQTIQAADFSFAVEQIAFQLAAPLPAKAYRKYLLYNKLKKFGVKETLIDIASNDLFTPIGSTLLMMRKDNKGIAYHSQTSADLSEFFSKYTDIMVDIDTWQKFFGYNDFYDSVFKFGTNNNMDNEKFYFTDEDTNTGLDENNAKYVLWIWRGNYLNLGSGAEMGIYQKYEEQNITDNVAMVGEGAKRFLSDNGHWFSVDFELPMTLSLYNYNKDDKDNPYDTIFNWNPENPQWWITGFNPDFKNPDVNKMISIGTVDFSKSQEYNNMYKSLKNNIINNKENKTLSNYLIFDDESLTVWIMWGDAI